MAFMLSSFSLGFIVFLLFLTLSKKMNWEKDLSISFECGFTSSFVSRFSFSMHFFTVGLIFLFLDLELCLVMPYLNESFSSIKLIILSWLFVGALLVGLLYEWHSNELDWKF